MSPRFEPIAADPSCDFCSGRRQAASIGIDAAYCISLIEQPERAAYAAAHFHAIGLCRQVTFYRPHRAKNTDRGVWASHRAVAEEALARGNRCALIMEDDVKFGRPMTEYAPRIARALAGLPQDWWGLYLGHFPFQAYFVAPNVMRTRSVLAHAYMASTPLLEWLAITKPRSAEVPVWPWVGYSVDSAMSNLPAMFAIVPMIARQKFLGGYRVLSTRMADGRLRALWDINRWRNLGIYHWPRIAEALTIVCSPFHASTLERNIARVRNGISVDAQNIRAAGLFDDEFYLLTYPDVAAAEFDPLLHYLLHGASEGRWPNASFDPVFYGSHATTLRRGENPLLHYIASGRQLGT